MQHEITESKNLLDGNNNIIEPGYAKKLLPIYNKRTDFKSRFHTKEWDYYYIGNEHFGLAVTLADNGYMGLDSISLLNFDEQSEITKSPMQFMTLGKKNFPASSVTGDVAYGNNDYQITFENRGNTRRLSGFMNKFENENPIIFDVTLSDIPEESMVICTPFEKAGHFYYNQKINCMSAEGFAQVCDRKYEFNKDNSFAVLDWGRGIWTYSNTWYWSSLNTSVDNHKFGWNLGYGFGDTSNATENMLFYDGKAHKLDQVTFNIPMDGDKYKYTDDWTITSNDNRVDVVFKPVLNRMSCTNVLIIKSDQNQVFGKFYGQCKLDDGTVIKLDGNLGFAERVENRW